MAVLVAVTRHYEMGGVVAFQLENKLFKYMVSLTSTSSWFIFIS